MNAIILAAGVGKRLSETGKVQPKCLLEVGGKKLLDRYLESLNNCGVKEVVLVLGFMADAISSYLEGKYADMNISFIINEEYTKGNILSAYTAKDYFDKPFLLMDADVAFPQSLLSRLLDSDKKDCLLIDRDFNNDAEEMKLGADTAGRVMEINRTLTEDYAVQGEGVGFFKSSVEVGIIFRDLLKKSIDQGLTDLEYEHVLNETMKETNIRYEEVAGLPWTEIDFNEDLQKAREIFST